MELARLIISVTVPIMIGICGYFVQKSIVAFETHRELTNDMTVKLTDRRLSVYDRISLPLNNIYCYIEEVCDWETLSAEEVKAIRKVVNRHMHAERAIWSPETFRLYMRYMDSVAFQRQKKGQEAKIRAEISRQRLYSAGWEENSAELLTGEKSSEHQTLYRQLSDSLAADLIYPGYR